MSRSSASFSMVVAIFVVLALTTGCGSDSDSSNGAESSSGTTADMAESGGAAGGAQVDLQELADRIGSTLPFDDCETFAREPVVYDGSRESEEEQFGLVGSVDVSCGATLLGGVAVHETAEQAERADELLRRLAKEQVDDWESNSALNCDGEPCLLPEDVEAPNSAPGNTRCSRAKDHHSDTGDIIDLYQCGVVIGRFRVSGTALTLPLEQAGELTRVLHDQVR